MTTLNLILDDILSAPNRGTAQYTQELASALIRYAPAQCFVEGFVASSTQEQYDSLTERLPGLHGLSKSALVRRDLNAAWQHGFTPSPQGMLHSSSLFAPLRKHDRLHQRANQIVVTIHDALAWTNPDLLAPRELSWTRAMAARAVKHADAVVVPTHAVAEEIDAVLALGDRVRVISGAANSRIERPKDADERAERLGLPGRYLVTVGDASARHGLIHLLAAMGLADATLSLVVVGAESETGAIETQVAEAGLALDRVVAVGALGDEDYSVALSGAVALVHPGLGGGFGTPLLDAFSLGVPVIHAATASQVELAGDAGLAIDCTDLDEYPARLAAAIDRVARDEELRSTLSIQGEDRGRVFTWRSTAESVWQLHADL